MKSMIFVATLLLSTQTFAADNPWDIKLPFKEAAVHYDISGNMKGNKVVYIKNYGRTSAEYTETSMTIFGMTQKQKDLNITTPDWNYSINLLENNGSKQTNPTKYFIEEFNKLSKSEQKKVASNAEKFGVNTLEGMQGKIEKNATEILGYRCDKTEMMGTTVYGIHGSGFPLKMESNMMGMKHSETATKIDKGSVPNSKFVPPENIQYRHDQYADQMMQNYAKNVIQSLLNDQAPAPMGGMQSAPVQQEADKPDSEQLKPEQQQQIQQLMKMFGG
ncbi:MAG: hypothetical protein U9R28_06500 [Pseudomonadota bacterium]|nr:hypothetical protein [Pseudomonadota bacterium]